jgi:hypothetical protein
VLGLPDRYFIDENMLSVGYALNAVRPDIAYPGHAVCTDIPREAKDPVWLPKVGQRGWAVVMRDKRIRHRPGERNLLARHRIRAFCLTGSGDQTSWEMLELLVRQWSNIEQRLLEIDGPFVYAITLNGLRRLAERQRPRAGSRAVGREASVPSGDLHPRC